MRKVRGFLRLVMIEHSVFALPFAYIAALTAMLPGLPQAGWTETPFVLYGPEQNHVRWGDLALVTVAMVAARTFAMAANRVIDRQLDARNPRTAQRELVTGAMSTRTAVIGAAVALVVFLAAAAALSPLCLALSPIVLVGLAGYPYAKRVTSLCHYILGLAQALAPVGAFIAVSGRWGSTRFLGLLHSAPLSAAIVLGLAVGLWIAGFDVIYACQDIESDRAEGVHSIPARFGARAALVISAVTHVATVALFVAFGVVAHFSWPWYLGVGLAAAALVYEHVIVKPDDLSRVNRAWFTVNGFIGVGLFGFALADLVHRGLRA